MFNLKDEVKTDGTKSSKTKKKPYEIKVFLDDAFRKVNVTYTPEEKEALALRAQESGRIEEQVIGWKEQHMLLWGYTPWDISKENNLDCDIEWKSFTTKADALAFVVEKKLAIPTVTLFEKIEAARQFGDYWKDKYGSDHPVCVAAAHKNKGVVDALGIIGVKAGASRSTSNKVNRILDSKNEALINQCRKGEISISTAYDSLKIVDEPEPNNNDHQNNHQEEVPDNTVLTAEQVRKDTRRTKEANILAEYSIKGFSNGEKLSKTGRKFFLLRWNEEHSDNCMTEEELETAIKNYGKEK